MIGPQKLVAVSLFFFIIFLCTVFFLRKKKHIYFYLVFLSSLLPLFSLLRTGVYQSGDFAINISKSVDLWNSIQYGIFPVHWASLLNATYGYPLFIFTYPLPYYSIVFLKILGLSFIASEKFVMAITFIFSGIGMYLLSKEFLKPRDSALAAILYLFAPYHLVDFHFRVALGEIFAYAFLPFVFYFVLKLSREIKLLYFLLLCISYFLLILSHQAITIVASPFIFAFPFFLKSKSRKILYLSLLSGMLLAAFYWLPAVIEINFTHQTTYAKSVSFESVLLYFTSPWRYGLLYQGPSGQISFPMGFVQIFLLALSFVLFYKKKVKKSYRKILTALHIIFLSLFALLIPISLPIWKILPFMTNFQFAYRLVLPISFLLALIGGIVAAHLGKKSVSILIFIAVFVTILNWGTRGMISDIGDAYLIRHAPLSTYEAEGLQAAAPKWRDINSIWIKTPPASHLMLLNGQASVVQVKRTPIQHEYRVSVGKPSVFQENTVYFPGWNLYVNDKKYPFTYVNSSKTGLISFRLPQGNYKIELKFEDTLPRRIGNTISLLTLLFIILFSGFQARPQRRK